MFEFTCQDLFAQALIAFVNPFDGQIVGFAGGRGINDFEFAGVHAKQPQSLLIEAFVFFQGAFPGGVLRNGVAEMEKLGFAERFQDFTRDGEIGSVIKINHAG